MANLGNVDVEYRKNKELNKEDIEILKEWTLKQPHLPNISEFQLILFLHSCYYRIEPTKTCIETYFTVRAQCPDFFQNRNPRHYADEIFDPMLMISLPRATPEGYQLMFVKFINLDSSRFIMQNLFKSADMAGMLNLYQNGTAPGHIVIIDMKGMSFGHLTKIYPSSLMKFLYYFQEGLPFRMKGFYFFNIPSFMDKIMNIMRPYLKNDLMNSLKMFDKIEDLYKFIPQEYFPSDYGGQAESISELVEKRKQVYLEHEQFFVDGENEVADESKRVGKPKHGQEVFGVEGTFKKLNID